MAFLTNDKLVIVGAAGMIGSNMVQTALMMGLTNNICLYDVFSAEGVAEEMRQSGFDNVNIVATTDIKEAFTNAKYIISSGGAPRKEGMTREDLLKGNCEIAEQLGKDIKTYCPDVKHVVIIFNPADLTGLVTLLHSGLKPSQVTTLAALDTTRLQSALAKKFGVMQTEITGCATYGGHGEQMAVFGSAVKVAGRNLTDIIGTEEFPEAEWEQMKKDVTQGGAKIIELRRRSSFQSPSYLSVEMIRSVMGGEKFRFQKPANDVDGYNNTIAYLKTALENADKQPMTAFSDSISATIFGHNPLKKRLHVEDLAQANYETIRQLYSERFQSAGDFDFFFTGAIDIDSLRAFTEQYIAPLPGLKKRESYKDRKLYPVEGSVNNHFKRSMETPQAILIQVWNGDLKYNMKNAVVLNALGEILTQRYLKSIREDAGAAYSVGASGGAEFGVRDMYMLQIYCPFKPALRDSVLLLMQEAIDDIAKNGVTSEELDKVKKFEIKNYADNQRKNSYWQGLISTKVRWSKDEQTGYEDTVNGISSDDIRQFVNGVMLKQKNCITVSMLPTDMSEK